MKRILVAGVIIGGLGIAALFLIITINPLLLINLFIPTPSAAMLYPPAPPLSPVTSIPVEHLLNEYELFLKSKAPVCFAALQPGLSDVDLDTLELKYHFKLTPDLRALYRWHNGAIAGANMNLFPNHRFMPLEDALIRREDILKQVSASSGSQQKIHSTFSGHRNNWIGIGMDLFGDGFFFDPDRKESDGSFFYNRAEDIGYIFYPAFRNYLAAVLDGEKAGVIKSGKEGIEISDYIKMHSIILQYGAVPSVK